MKWLVLLGLLAQGQTMTGKWVGPLELTIHAPKTDRGALPTEMELTQNGDAISGTWRSLPPNTISGTISGTSAKLTIVFYADSDTAPERCQALVEAKAAITPSNIYRIEAREMIPDHRARKECGPWPTDLVWLLQRH